MFINLHRLHDLTRGREDLKSQFRWETINAVFYKIGRFLFIIGNWVSWSRNDLTLCQRKRKPEKEWGNVRRRFHP